LPPGQNKWGIFRFPLSNLFLARYSLAFLLWQALAGQGPSMVPRLYHELAKKVAESGIFLRFLRERLNPLFAAPDLKLLQLRHQGLTAAK